MRVHVISSATFTSQGRNKTKVKPGTTRDPAATPQWAASKSQTPVKRSSHKAPRSGTKTLPKGCPSEFVVFMPSSLGSPEPYVTARAVIDPDYHGDPLLSNALVPYVGNALVVGHEFVPFTGELNSDDIARPLQVKVKPSGWGSFDYKAARTDGSFESLRDKLQFFEDLMLQVFIFGHGRKKDEGEYPQCFTVAATQIGRFVAWMLSLS
ncbi:hypothetical protein ACHAP0_001693 [Verticillium nonalfalfae]